MLEGFIGYSIYESGQYGSRFVVDLLGGLRYSQIDFNLDVEASALNTAVGSSPDRTKDWLDGVIGLRATQQLNQCWNHLSI